jgi:hypothetical protein
VMFRENLSPGSKNAFMTVTSGGGSVFQHRSKTDDSSGNTDGPLVTVPHWLKLVRAGDTFTGFVSADGNDWQRVESVTIPMEKTLYVGLALSAHNNSALNSTLFDHVSVSP